MPSRFVEPRWLNGTERDPSTQERIAKAHGSQCGFCTPGQVVTAVALLKANPNPTVDEARVAMSGNMCRCGAYDHYLKAVMRAAKEA